MVPTLSQGALSRIIAGEHIENPIVQILGFKKIPSSTDKYRFLISDGVMCHPYSMLGTQLNSRLENKEFEKYTIVCLNKYIVNQVQPNKRIMILLELTVIASGASVGQKIGNPTDLNAENNSNDGNQQPPANAPSNNLINGDSTVNQPFGNDSAINRPFSNAQPGGRSTAYGSNQQQQQQQQQNAALFNIHPVNSLTPYQNRWTIRARVSNKSNIRTWSNSRGEGKLFSMDLLDESGEIRATAFNEQCDKFYDTIELDKVYYISKCTLKTANKKFTSIKNEYEMSFTAETTVIPCNDNVAAIPTLQFDFVPIFEIQNVEKDSFIDVIGVCKSCSDIQNLVARTTNRELKKRDVHLVDKTGVEVILTLWDTDAEKFDGSTNPIVAVKGAKVSDFGGKSLSVSSGSKIQINPDIREAHMLRGWYDREGATAETQSISSKSFGGSQGSNSVWKTFAQAKAEMLGAEKADYYSSKSHVVLIKRENCLYMACQSQDCNKKVVDMNNGRYRCEKCNQEYDGFKWRLILQACLCDFSANQWVTCFQETAETMLGVTAEELGRLKEQEEDRFNEILTEANFNPYIFRLRVKMEVYNEESKFKTTVIAANPIVPKEYSQKLLHDIRDMEPHL